MRVGVYIASLCRSTDHSSQPHRLRSDVDSYIDIAHLDPVDQAPRKRLSKLSRTQRFWVWLKRKTAFLRPKFRGLSMDKLREVLALPDAEQKATVLALTSLSESPSEVFVLGARHNIDDDPAALFAQLASLPRFTYRTGFDAVEGYSTDVGWGCMMRTGQMAVANALVRLTLPPGWRLDQDIGKEYREVLRHFADEHDAALSIQNMASTGRQLDVSVGQWFGPTTVCHVLRRLAASRLSDVLRVMVAQDSVVSEAEARNCSDAWSEPFLLLVPLRLGLGTIQPELAALAADTVTWPMSVGILGGKPRTSYLFVAKQGDMLVFLDPHHAQPVVDMGDPDFPLETFHSAHFGLLKCSELDPSLALAFVCRGKEDFDTLQSRLQQQASEGKHQLFTIAREKPKGYVSKAQPKQNGDDAEEDDWNFV